MTKPAILTQIDEALKSVLPAGIRPWMDEAMAAEVRLFLAEEDHDGPMIRQYWYRGVEAPIVTVPGWGVRTLPGFDKPEGQPRDPETGRFI